MNEPVTKQRQQTDFEEFERFMRESTQPDFAQPSFPQPASSQRPVESDPLSELARLVGNHHDPYRDVFAREAQHAPQDSAPLGQHHGSPQPAPRPSIDFAAIEAGLRGTIPAHDAGQAAHEHYAVQSDAYHEPQGEFLQGAATQASRSKRPIFAMAAVIVAGVVGIGVAFAYKGANSGPREIAMIKAAPGPTKIQPPADDTTDQPTRDASILDKAQQPAPIKTVSREEQPVDLDQSVKSAPRDVGSGITPIYNFGFPGGDAASGAVSAPPAVQPEQPLRQPDAIGGIASDIEPIHVKTRSYRPDGTPIPNDQPPVAAIDQPSPVAAKAEKPVAKPSSPKVAAPKSTTRIATPTKPTVLANRDAEPADLSPPVAPPHKVKKVVKPVRPPEAAAPADDATAPRQAVAARDEAPRQDAPQQDAAQQGGGGGFAVQLAAPGSESEARETSSRLSQKYASELSGHDLSFHKAVSKGKSIYRVRVSGLSREEAAGMCEKLKSSGGNCFIAKN